MGYHLYGDNNNRTYSQSEFEKHFKLLGPNMARCVKSIVGDPKKHEYFSFFAGCLCEIMPTQGSGVYRVKLII